MRTLFIGVLWALTFGAFVVTPILLIWTWARWARQPMGRSVWAIVSLTGLTFASASAALAIAALVYSRLIGGDFPHHFDDALFMRMFECGLLLARIGVGISICGLWRKTALRWPAFACAIGMLIFWKLTGGD